jgi:hypothetical protein
MRATVVRRDALGGYSAQTDNDIAISFAIADGNVLSLGDEIDVDLVEVTRTKTVVRVRDRQRIAIEVRDDDLHDLRLPSAHGVSRVPSESRRRGEKERDQLRT